jgi:6-pyruvoyl-tetrahydropterin synthase
MQYFGVAKAEFESSNKLDKLVGHRYWVEAECAGRFDIKTGLAVDLEGFGAALLSVVGELHLRHLPDMMPGVTTTPFGIASWFMERLLEHWPVVRVSVGENEWTSATVIREVRAHGPGNPV